MMSKKANKDHIELFHEYGIYIPTRTIYVGSETYSEDGEEGGVDGMMAERFLKNMHTLDSLSSRPITVIANNTGGDEYHGFAMYDAILAAKSQVTIKVSGHAFSMGSIILQAADTRIMAQNAVQMLHYGTWGAAEQHAKTVQKWAKEGERIDKWMEKMYLKRMQEKHPKFKLEDLQKMLDHDTYLTAEESVELGLADKILKGKS
jgi:ATP-dependent protease ClpP protease subunit